MLKTTGNYLLFIAGLTLIFNGLYIDYIESFEYLMYVGSISGGLIAGVGLSRLTRKESEAQNVR